MSSSTKRLRRRDEAEAAEIARGAEQARLRRRARHRAFALGAAVAATTTVAIVAFVAGAGTGNPPHIELVTSGGLMDDAPGALYEAGLVRAERDFDLDVDRRDVLPAADTDTVIDDLDAADADLVILDPDAARTIEPEDLDPATRYLLTEFDGHAFDGLPNVTSHQWADEHAGFLAGVAAATTTETGTVGFLGATQTGHGQEDYRAGFEAGVESIDPDIRVLAAYLDAFGYRQEPNDAPEGGRLVADQLYDAGADVIFHVAGRSGLGVLEAASQLSTNNLWAIGIETGAVAVGEHATTTAHSDVDPQTLRRADLPRHRRLSRRQP